MFSGLWTVSIDPIFGDNGPVETMNWQLSGTNVAAVPLPASGLFLLAALGGLAATRRKSRAA